jgi:hypothetical protein
MAEETEVLTTDEEILDSIGEGDESTSTESTSEQSAGTTSNAETTASTTGREQGTTTSDGKQQQQKSSGPQDLVGADGAVIATGGKERRFYETAQREKQRADGLNNEVSTLRANIEAINNAGTLGTQYDLTPEEVTTGAQIIASYKKNPAETIQYMLTQAQASGHNVDAVGGGNNMNLDAVQQMLTSALAPLVSEHQERADTQAANNRALEIYNDFSSKYPDAAVHENSLARLLEQEATLSPEAAYFKLQSYYSKNGLDWTKSLAQLQADQQTARDAGGNTQQALPDGNINVNNVTDTAQVADVNTSTDDIIREAMAEAGIT